MIANGNSTWKVVPVSLSDPGNDYNHYDNASKTASKANRDLEAQQSESCGMFLGLEVLDGSMYSVINNRLVIKSQPEITNEKESCCSSKSQKLSEKMTSTKENLVKAKKKRKMEEIETTSTSDSYSTEFITDIQNDPDDVLKNKTAKVQSKADVHSTDTSQGALSDGLTNGIIDLQGSWMAATGGVCLHAQICEGLMKQGFQTPTPIQAATLPPAILGRRNIVGAAATGSGKTLAYLIPLLQFLLDEGLEGEKLPLRALIIAPTRELALQVSEECEKLIPKTTVTIVGGLAPHKQARILETRKPPFAIGTPGRLWQMVRT
jgi:ATP-dependent RNA helicase DDX24/MAK5